MLRIQSKPIRTVLRWQLIATVALALMVGLAAGIHGSVSAALGGSVGVIAGLAFAAVIQLSKPQSAGGTLATPLRDDVERDLRSRLERVRMDSLVTRTLAAGGVTVLDRSLDFGYENLAKPR